MSDPSPDWPEALATVLSCTYTARVGRAIAFGLPSSRHFRITYNYWAEGAIHTGEFYAAKPIPQGNFFPIHYNPELPHTSREAGGAGTPMPPSRRAMLLIGVAGSVLLSLGWLLVLKGCS